MKEIDEKTYMERVTGLNPIETFSDPEGILPYGYGIPAMDTVWGHGDQKVLFCEMRKDSRHDKEWQTRYFEF